MGKWGVIFGVLSVCAVSAATPLTERLRPSEKEMGFEIGNGRPMFVNAAGGYSLDVRKDWEIGASDTYSEIIASLSEGTPRARAALNLIEDQGLPAGRWKERTIGGLPAYETARILASGLTEVEIRIPRNDGKVLVVTLNGKPAPNEPGGFASMRRAIDSLEMTN